MGDTAISVIVPIYNAENHLIKCLDSLVNQTCDNVEIILINDGSTDKSSEICKSYAERYENIVYREQENAGVSAARNLGISIASGKYLAFCDCDDYYELDAFDMLYELAEKANSDWMIGAVRKEFKDKVEYADCGDVIADDKQKVKKMIVESTENFMIYQLWGKLYKREIIDKNELRMTVGMQKSEDFEFNCRFIANSSIITSTKAVTYHYVIRDSSSLSSKFIEKHYKNIQRSYEAAIEMYDAHGFNGDETAFFRNQQAARIWGTVCSVNLKSCHLSTKEKKRFISECLRIDSFNECVKHNRAFTLKKRMVLMTKNPLLILFITGLLYR